MLAWHFLSEDKRLCYGDGRVVEVGVPLECEGEPKLCDNGMHGSIRLIDALYYASGSVVCRVEIEGDIIEGDDKLCGRRRTVLWMLDAAELLHEFACQCAEDALTLVDNPDPRSVAAIAAKRKWLSGEIADEELTAACSAAWAAVDNTADAPAEAAARAAERDARAAARAAAWAAARGVERDAALAAVGAAWAAWAAAQADAGAQQNVRLTEMVMAAHDKEGEQ